ncbi:MAG: ATP-binding protein [Leptospiraceae bacterium]|mgnify:CR=1 FL=1|nr:ATP-binding protein [Leptospiraceae bacterium]MCB1305232.1 ATP-binding protein [Leptospiraceae bacterium]
MQSQESQKPAETLRLQFPSHPRFVAQIRQFVYDACMNSGFTRPAAFDMKVLTGEAVANIIRHAYENRTDRPVFIEMLFYRTYLEMRFKDLGRRSPVGQDLARDLSDYRETGLGIYLISHLSDYHYFDQSGEVGTTLVIKKRIR